MLAQKHAEQQCRQVNTGRSESKQEIKLR